MKTLVTADKNMNRKTLSFSSGEVISYNDDLLLQILIALPAKSLISFKSVSRRWLSLISNASFRQRHTRRHRSPQTSFLLRVSPSQFYHFNPSSKNFVPFHFNFDDEAIIRQSCNGLLLVQCGKDYYVCNPTTGESRNLLFPKHINFSDLFLAFDPWKSPHYKVYCNGYPPLAYDSKRHRWSPEGKVYWEDPPVGDCVYSDNFIYSIFNELMVLCLNIENPTYGSPFYFEEFEEQRRLKVLCIMESFGHVHRVAHNLTTNYLEVDDILTGKNGELSFKRLFDFDFKDWCPDKTICFLGITRGSGEECLVFHIPGKIMAYRFYEGTFEELLDCSGLGFYKNDTLQFVYGNSCQFVESLAPV